MEPNTPPPAEAVGAEPLTLDERRAVASLAFLAAALGVGTRRNGRSKRRRCSMKFYAGISNPAQLDRVTPAFLSYTRVENRKKPLPPPAGCWALDSGGFTILDRLGAYPDPPTRYAEFLRWLAQTDRAPDFAAAQDYPCNPGTLAATGLAPLDHIGLTVERYRRLVSLDTGGVYVLPVLQGDTPERFAACIEAYGYDLEDGAYVGVGSVATRGGFYVAAVLDTITALRPDLRLHGFGVGRKPLSYARVRSRLASADSAAWALTARMTGRNQNDPAEALRYARLIQTTFPQSDLFSDAAPESSSTAQR